jgi:cytoskeletal protein RodZ
MENKKILIPIILGSALLLGIVFNLVYKKTNEDPFKEPEVQTLATKETKEKEVETKVVGENNQGLNDFDVNEIKPVETIETTEMEFSNNIAITDNESVINNEQSSQSNDDINKVTVGVVDKNEDGTIIGLLPNGDAVSTLNTPNINSSHVYSEAEAVALDGLNDYWREHNISKDDLRIMLNNEVYKNLSDQDKDAIVNDIFEKNPHNNPTEKLDIPTENKEPEVILGDGPANLGEENVVLK